MCEQEAGGLGRKGQNGPSQRSKGLPPKPREAAREDSANLRSLASLEPREGRGGSRATALGVEPSPALVPGPPSRCLGSVFFCSDETFTLERGPEPHTQEENYRRRKQRAEGKSGWVGGSV